jgi:hypothetical protein
LHGRDRGVDVIERYGAVDGIGGVEHVGQAEGIRRHLTAHPVCLETGRDLERFHRGRARRGQTEITEHPRGDPPVVIHDRSVLFRIDAVRRGSAHDDSAPVRALIA